MTESVPAPPPPTKAPQTVPESSRQQPDREVDPFLDDEVNRVRRVPAKPIRYQGKASNRTSYGEAFDPQASKGGVRFRFSDLNEEPPRIEIRERTRHIDQYGGRSRARVMPASARTNSDSGRRSASNPLR